MAFLPNVFSAFQSGRSGGASTQFAFSRAQSPVEAQKPDGETANLVGLLRTLALNPEGRDSFADFTRGLPGDSVAKLSVTVGLMKEGWLEFVGGVDENSDLRITDAGRQVVATLNGAIAQT